MHNTDSAVRKCFKWNAIHYFGNTNSFANYIWNNYLIIWNIFLLIKKCYMGYSKNSFPLTQVLIYFKYYYYKLIYSYELVYYYYHYYDELSEYDRYQKNK